MCLLIWWGGFLIGIVMGIIVTAVLFNERKDE